MTGTKEFMAIEVLEDVDHTYRHDLESFFYVLIWMCVGYGWGKGQKPEIHPLHRWYYGTAKDIVIAKRGDVTRNFEDYVLAEFSPIFNCIKGLARSLRNMLFSETTLFTGTPKDEPPGHLHKSMIKAFNDAIKELE